MKYENKDRINEICNQIDLKNEWIRLINAESSFDKINPNTLIVISKANNFSDELINKVKSLVAEYKDELKSQIAVLKTELETL